MIGGQGSFPAVGGVEPDYYGLIGVDRGASLHEIRSKFRAQVLAEHPDKGGDPKKFQMLNKAYNVLTDQEKRRRYDATGRAEKSAEEEFAEGFGGGRFHFEPRAKDADEQAITSLEDRIISKPQTHEEGFMEWLRQRDQGAMVLTDKDFMKTHLFNSAELAVRVNHPGPVHHVLGTPKSDPYGNPMIGTVVVQAKPKAIKKTLEHDELLVRMLAVPVDDSMVFADISKPNVCLGWTGVGRIEQKGSRVDDFNQEEAVLIVPRPAKFSSDKPIGSARTLVHCCQDDVIKVPAQMLEDLTPEQISLTPAVVSAYIILEQYSSKLRPGDSVLINSAHLGASGAALLQLCRLLKLKPLCIVNLPGMAKNSVKGEWGSKEAWQNSESAQAHVMTPAARARFEEISEHLCDHGAEEVFPDALSLLKWRDRNQRMLPRLAVDGVCTKESVTQLIHCLQSGDKDAKIVLCGHGKTEYLEIPPPLLAAWGGRITGFNFAKWVHQSSKNQKTMLTTMTSITNLIRLNKFSLETTLYKVNEDSISDAFSRAEDQTNITQVVLIFPMLSEELETSAEEQRKQKLLQAQKAEQEVQKKKEEDEREKLKEEWLNLLFTDQSVAAMQPEGPLQITMQAGEQRRPTSMMVWIGDNPQTEDPLLRDTILSSVGTSGFMTVDWALHTAGESYSTFSLKSPEVLDGSWYLVNRSMFGNEHLDLLHDLETLGRSLKETVETRLSEHGLSWKNVCLMGFGKGAGIALYAALLKLLPELPCSMYLFNPVVPFPDFVVEKMRATGHAQSQNVAKMKLVTVWGQRDRCTPGPYRQKLLQVFRGNPAVHATPDTRPGGDHTFDVEAAQFLQNLMPLIKQSLFQK